MARDEIFSKASEAEVTLSDPGIRRALDEAHKKYISAIEQVDTSGDVHEVVDAVQKLQALNAVKRELVGAIAAGDRKRQRLERSERTDPPLQAGHIRGKRTQ